MIGRLWDVGCDRRVRFRVLTVSTLNFNSQLSTLRWPGHGTERYWHCVVHCRSNATPSTDMAIGIYQNFLRRHENNHCRVSGSTFEDFKALNDQKELSGDDFYELMSKSLREIDNEFRNFD